MGSSCERFESHPGVPLARHLGEVGKAVRRRLTEAGVRSEELLRLGELIGKCHDIGKYTEYFQERIRGHGKGRGSYRRDLYSHAPLSAAYTAWAANRMFCDPFYVAAAMLCVYRHHGNLSDSLYRVPELLDEILNNKDFKEQARSISKCASTISSELQGLGLPDLSLFIRDFENRMEGVSITLRQACRSPRGYGIEDLFTLLLLFSALIDSDKMEAAGLETTSRIDVDPRAVDDYLLRKFGSAGGVMVELRRRLYRDVIGRLEARLGYGPVPRVMTITAPTGSGKTLLSLSVALRLRERIYRDTGLRPRIVYVLPYINIIEQTYRVFSEVLWDGGGDPPIGVLMKHHHLYHPGGGGDEVPLEEALMLVESWESEVVVTTFVQLLETLIGTRNSRLKKFHKLYGSIIILDEVQTLPVDYWLLVRRLVEALSRVSYVIFMTATMPAMLAEGARGQELVGDREKYFASLNRVTYIYEEGEKTVDEAADFVLDKWGGEGSILVIVNKISTSIELYQRIKERLREERPLCISEGTEVAQDRDGVVLAYLSTNITPKERLRRVTVLKNLLERRRKVICVSTQLVEAGVDLDFDKVVRDIAPLDSIIQAGGRCNRNWTATKGTVYIIKLRDDKGELDGVQIYGELTIRDITEPLLKKWREWDEGRILDCITEYFGLVEEKLGPGFSDKSRRLLDAIRRLDFEDLRRFRLIEEEPKTAFFVATDPDALAVLEDFRRAWEAWRGGGEDRYRQRAVLRASRARLEEYIVETWRVDGLPDERIADGIDIRYIPSERVGEYYDRETGLRRAAGVQATFW